MGFLIIMFSEMQLFYTFSKGPALQLVCCHLTARQVNVPKESASARRSEKLYAKVRSHFRNEAFRDSICKAKAERLWATVTWE